MSDRLSEIEARLAAATPGPWEEGHRWVFADPTDPDEEANPIGIAHRVALNDVGLIAHAPADLSALVEFARQVKASVTSSWRAHDPNFDIIRDLLNDLEHPGE